MEKIIRGRKTRCTNPPQSPAIYIDETFSARVIASNIGSTSSTAFVSRDNNHLQCHNTVENSYSVYFSNSGSDSGSGSGTNNTATYSVSYSIDFGRTEFSSGKTRCETDKLTECCTNESSRSFTSFLNANDYTSGSTFNSGSTTSNATRDSSTSSSSSSSSTNPTTNTETSSTTTFREENCSTFGNAGGLPESTTETVSDTVYYDEIKQFITKTSNVCSTDITETNPILSFKEKSRTTESYSKFVASTTDGNFPVETETQVDYYQTKTISTDWTQTEQTNWTSTETSDTEIFTTIEEAVTTNSRNSLGELIEYDTTQRKNTTTDATTTVLGTTTKETTVTGGTTETTTAELSQTQGTETTLTEGQISTWVEGSSSRFKTGTSRRDIQTSDLAFCDYGGWVDACITHSQQDYIASIKLPVSGGSPFYTSKESTLLDTGQTNGAVNYYFTTDFHLENAECLIEWIEPALNQTGTIWLNWDEVFSSSSVGEVESTSYSIKTLKRKALARKFLTPEEIVTRTDMELRVVTRPIITLNSVPQFNTADNILELQHNETQYNSAPKTIEKIVQYFLEKRGGSYNERAFADTAVDTTYTDLVRSTSASKVLLPVKFSTEYLGKTHSHLFGWDLVDQEWTYETCVTYEDRMISYSKIWIVEPQYKSSSNTYGTTSVETNQQADVFSYYSDEDRNIINFAPQEGFSEDEANFLYDPNSALYNALLLEMTAVYEPDLAIGYIGFGEVLQEELALASAYGFMKKESAGETFHSDDELNIDLTNISSAALLAADSASIFYTNDCFAPAFGEQTGTTSWGNTRKCTDEDDAVLFNTSTEIHATYSKEYETDNTTSISYAYATYSLSLDMPFEGYPNPLLLKASILDSVAGNRTPNDYRQNHMVQLKNLTNNISYTMKRGEYEVKAFDNSNNIIADETQTSQEDIIRVVNDGNTNIRKITANELLLYQRRNHINGQGPLYPQYQPNSFSGFTPYNRINPSPEFRYFSHFSFTRSDLRSTASNSGRVDGWLGPTKILCDSTG